MPFPELSQWKVYALADADVARFQSVRPAPSGKESALDHPIHCSLFATFFPKEPI